MSETGNEVKKDAALLQTNQVQISRDELHGSIMHTKDNIITIAIINTGIRVELGIHVFVNHHEDILGLVMARQNKHDDRRILKMD